MRRTASAKLPPPREETEQIALFTWARMASGKWPELLLMFHIPNGGSRNPVEAAKFKRMGVKSGVPDIFLPCMRKNACGLFLELKRQRGGRTSEEQEEWIQRLRDSGYCVKVCRGFEEARAAIMDYLEGKEDG